MNTIKTMEADDGTELALKERDGGDFIVTERGSADRTGEVARSRSDGERQLQETSRLFGVAESSRNGAEGSGFGQSVDSSMGDFGSAGSSDRKPSRDGSQTGGGLFGAIGGGSSDARRERDTTTGRFAPMQREPADFKMERDAQGRFQGRADGEDSNDRGGFLSGFLR